MHETVENNLERKIIEAARSLFIEKGFAETSMSEIAAKVGINRPTLHYYFRTKDKMFKAVFGEVIKSIIPKVQNIIQNSNEPIGRRIENVVNTYYGIFSQNPCLPMFIIREMNRDTDYMIDTIEALQLKESFRKILLSLQREMKQGNLKSVPVRVLFYSFYSMLIFPFLTRDFSTRMLLDKGESFDAMLEKWKPYIVSQMENLLCSNGNNHDARFE